MGRLSKRKGLLAILLTTVVLCALVVSGIMSSALLAGESIDWPQFQKDKINSGKTLSPAPISDISIGWREHVGGGVGCAGIDIVPLVADGKVFVFDALAGVWAFDSKTGAQIWKTDLSSGALKFQLSTPAYAQGRLFVATVDGHVYALNATDGSQYWVNPVADTGDQLNTPLKYADDKIYVGSWNGKTYYCLDISDGHVIWERPSTSDSGYYWAGACAIWDYLVYGDDASILTCVNKDTGTLVDEENLKEVVADAREIRSSVTYDEASAQVYFADQGGYCWAYSFNSTSGDLAYQWHHSIGYSTSTPAVHSGKVYVGQGGYSGDGKLYCLNAVDGTESWAFNPNCGVQSSPSLSIQDGHTCIYFNRQGENGAAYCLDEDGNELWHFITYEAGTCGGYVLQGMAISDGWVYFGNDGGYLYALTTCPDWDVNMDGDIDTQDIVLVGMHCGESGTQGWIREDVNNDGDIDTQDIVVIGMHWGE